MTAIPNSVFNNSDVWLRVWFNDGINGSQQLAPDQRIAAVGYAMIAGNVSDGAITFSKIANGAVSASKLASGAAVANLNASGQSGVASGGLVLSATDNNSALTNAGYVKVGTIDTGGGVWQQRINTPSLETARYNHTAVWTGSEMIIWGGTSGSGSLNDGGRYNPATNRWTAMTTSGAPSARTSHSAIWTGSEMIVWGGNNGSDSNSTVNNGGGYNPVANTWTGVTTSGAPSRRSAHRAVWTGSEMIVWGGTTNGFNSLDDGGRYDPVANTWTVMAADGAPSARQSHSAVWTGSEMIVWGGFAGFIPVIPLNDGRRYRPADNTWTAVSTSGAPVARYGHTAVWTGGEMIVWGGINGSNTWNDGGRYDPVGDSWGTALTTTSAPAARAYHTAVWTGSEMIVWGGNLNATYFNDGGRYNPAANSWTAVATTSAPAARWFHTAVWTGSAMIVWGGTNATTAFKNGGRYNPAGNSWTAVAMTAPAARRNHTAVWTGSEMIVWGGNSNIGGSPFLNDGGRYNPVIDGWAAVNTAGAPAARAGHTAVWSGTEMIVWGGGNGLDTFVDGGRYNPAANTWAPVTATGAPSARFGHTAVWTGNLSTMVVWGGADNNELNTGGVYNPSTNSWTAIPINASTPAGRIGHSAVWTGTEMLVWGGKHFNQGSFAYEYFNDGGRFGTGWGSGFAIPTTGAPSPREGHSAVWTGNEMIIWGGTSGTYFNNGGRYNPTSNTWAEFLTYGVPAERAFHKAFWTGKDMIVWGGRAFQGGDVTFNDGGRYDGTWAPIPASGGPPVHSGFTAVWTGTEMLLWGGSNFGTDIWAFKPNTSMFLYQRP